MSRPLILNLFSFVPLFFAIAMSIRFKHTSSRNKYFLITNLLALLAIVLSILNEYIPLLSDSNKIVVLKRIYIHSEVSLYAAIPYFLLKFNLHHLKNKLYNILLRIPLWIQLILCVMGLWVDLYYGVGYAKTIYRGPLFLISIIIPFSYFGLFLFFELKKFKDYERVNKYSIIVICFIPTLITSYLYILRNIQCLNLGVSFSLLLYYIFCIDMRFDYDLQTGVRNRNAFKKNLIIVQNKHSQATVIMFDVNHLKIANDTYGHVSGDILIETAAQTIRNFFREKGKTYRIGGDEFCVIAPYMTDEMMDKLLFDFQQNIEIDNKGKKIPLSLAMGYSSCVKGKGVDEDIYKTLDRADRNMYENKRHMKASRK